MEWLGSICTLSEIYLGKLPNIYCKILTVVYIIIIQFIYQNMHIVIGCNVSSLSEIKGIKLENVSGFYSSLTYCSYIVIFQMTP